jgi:hypothetical protein
MDTPPLLVTEAQRQKDNEHIKLLSIFHLVVSGLALFGIAFLLLHYFMMSIFFSHPERWKAEGTAPPAEFFRVFVWLYLFMGAMLVAGCVANVLSGVFLRKRKHRMFSLVVAGLDCLQVPFGTALGVLTIIVLLRDSVRQSYERL